MFVLESIPYFMLVFAIITLWVKNSVYIWLPILIIAYILAFIMQVVSSSAFMPVALLLCCVYIANYYFPKYYNILYIIIMIVAFSMMHHLFPGYYNIKIFDHVVLGNKGSQLSMYLNLDKAAAALVLLATCCKLCAFKGDGALGAYKVMQRIVIFLSVIAIFAYFSGNISFDLKWSNYNLLWILNNAFVVATAEEALFRGMVQQRLYSLFFKLKYRNYYSIILASILFLFIHPLNNPYYLLFVFVAGCFYGYIYYLTAAIEWAIFAHFLLNFIHLIFFSYPF